MYRYRGFPKTKRDHVGGVPTTGKLLSMLGYPYSRELPIVGVRVSRALCFGPEGVLASFVNKQTAGT